jgi:hypothetical protein
MHRAVGSQILLYFNDVISNLMTLHLRFSDLNYMFEYCSKQNYLIVITDSKMNVKIIANVFQISYGNSFCR